MRALIQRVTEARVDIGSSTTGRINKGLLILLGIEGNDDQSDIEWLCPKIARMRIFNDEEGKMNLSVGDVNGEVMVVSQFTLHASTKKGNRPSFIKAAAPEQAIPLYETFISELEKSVGKPVASGVFGADMQICLINDGPVTIWIDSKNKE